MDHISLSTKDIILLSQIKGIGFERLKQLVEQGFSLQEISSWKSKQWDAFFGKFNLYHSFKHISPNVYKHIEETLSFADKCITYWDQDYPTPLRTLPNPPPYIFLKGNISLLQEPLVAIVGTRNITSYGKYATYHFSNELIEQGYTVVSGFARGVDSVAHHSVLQNGGNTICVLGCGLDVIYPSQNKILYNTVLEKNGLFVSEHLLKTKPDAPNFPKRNRIIAGLSDAILVIEAGKKSGSLITAELGLEYGKEIFALPGQINSKQSEGTNQIIKDGAFLVQDIDDIISVLNPKKSSPKQLDLFELSEKEKCIIHTLSIEPKHIDEISQQLNIPIQELSNDLLMMELSNKISDVGGKCYISTIST